MAPPGASSSLIEAVSHFLQQTVDVIACRRPSPTTPHIIQRDKMMDAFLDKDVSSRMRRLALQQDLAGDWASDKVTW